MITKHVYVDITQSDIAEIEDTGEIEIEIDIDLDRSDILKALSDDSSLFTQVMERYNQYVHEKVLKGVLAPSLYREYKRPSNKLKELFDLIDLKLTSKSIFDLIEHIDKIK